MLICEMLSAFYLWIELPKLRISLFSLQWWNVWHSWKKTDNFEYSFKNNIVLTNLYFKLRTEALCVLKFNHIGLCFQRKLNSNLNNKTYIMFPKTFPVSDRRLHSVAWPNAEYKLTFVTAITLKQQRVLLQQGNQQSGDSRCSAKYWQTMDRL